jgi:hypothetical protein
MPKLTVWIATQEGDSAVYNIIARTRGDALWQIKQRPHAQFEPPKKVVIEYHDAFDLFDLATGEAGGRHTHY